MENMVTIITNTPSGNTNVASNGSLCFLTYDSTGTLIFEHCYNNVQYHVLYVPDGIGYQLAQETDTHFTETYYSGDETCVIVVAFHMTNDDQLQFARLSDSWTP